MWIFLPNQLLRGWLFLKCAAAGFLGGLVLLISPSLGMFWQGVVLIAVGGLSLAIFVYGIRLKAAPDGRTGPTFDVDPAQASALASTTTQLIDGIRRERRRQKRAEE